MTAPSRAIADTRDLDSHTRALTMQGMQGDEAVVPTEVAHSSTAGSMGGPPGEPEHPQQDPPPPPPRDPGDPGRPQQPELPPVDPHTPTLPEPRMGAS